MDIDPKDRTTWPELLTVDQAALVLRMAENTVRKALQDGDVRGRKIGTRWYIYKDDLFRPDNESSDAGE